MLGKVNIMDYKENDLIICCPRDDSKREKSNINFEIYARIVKIDDTGVDLDCYQEQGKLHMSDAGVRHLKITDLDEFYRPMREEEKTDFLNGLFLLKTGQVINRWKSCRRANDLSNETYDVVYNAIHERADIER